MHVVGEKNKKEAKYMFSPKKWKPKNVNSKSAWALYQKPKYYVILNLSFGWF